MIYNTCYDAIGRCCIYGCLKDYQEEKKQSYVLRNVADLNLLRLDPNPQIIPNIVTQLHYQFKKKKRLKIFLECIYS